tara:strand:+ start:92 stop:220 length:129 start_codon:yes stop_codon:yes gene_type:complete
MFDREEIDFEDDGYPAEDEGQPTWEQEWADFGEVYDDCYEIL